MTCEKLDYSLKYLSCFINHHKFDSILGHIFPFLHSFGKIAQHNRMKSVIFAIEIVNKLFEKCFL